MPCCENQLQHRVFRSIYLVNFLHSISSFLGDIGIPLVAGQRGMLLTGTPDLFTMRSQLSVAADTVYTYMNNRT